MEETAQYHVEKVAGPYSKSLQDAILKFLYALTVEQDSFLLTQDQVLKARELFILRDAQNQKVLGLGGIRPQKYYGLFFLVVHKDFQGMGLGKKLMESVLDGVDQNRLLLVTVHRSNVKARKLYKTHKFATIHRHRVLAYMVYENKIGRLLKWPVTLVVALHCLFN